MLPLRDRNPASRTAYLTLGLIAANVALFLLWQPTFSSAPEEEKAADEAIFFYCHGLLPWEVSHQKPLADGGTEAAQAIDRDTGQDGLGAALVQVLGEECPDKSILGSLFTSMFMHGGFLHIVGNMLFLFVFGNNVEDKTGYTRYLIFYLACGLLASGAHILSGPDSAIPTVGASGAIAGVLGAYLVMFPRRRVVTLVVFYLITTVELPAVVLLGFWFALQFLPVLQSLGGAGAGVTDVAVWAHIGGFVAGALFALALFPKERGDPYAAERIFPY